MTFLINLKRVVVQLVLIGHQNYLDCLRKNNYFLIPSALFFNLSWVLLHFRHLVALISNLQPHAIHIFICNLAFCAICFFSGSATGILIRQKSAIYSIGYSFCLLGALQPLLVSWQLECLPLQTWKSLILLNHMFP